MRQIVLGLFCLLLLALACNQPNGRRKVVRETDYKLVQKDYEPFLEKFLTDSVTQLSSINFPLKSVIQGDDGDVIKFIERKDWEYQNFRESYIITSKLIDDSEFEMTVQIEDTGVHVIYSFIYENGRWVLTLIEDSST